MAYYVLLWNPASDKTSLGVLAERPDQRSETGSWSCGNSKGIVAGDIVILRRTGRGPKGVVGIGIVTEGSYEERWSGTDEMGLFVDVNWKRITDEPIIDRDDPDVSGMDRLWGAQAGGTRIPDDEGAVIVAKLDEHDDWSFVPSSDQFVTHWKASPPSENQRKMLITHYWSPESEMHPDYMSQTMGWPSPSTSHLHYGKFAGQTAKAMRVEQPSRSDNIALFAAWIRTSDGVKWVMHDQVRAAIAQLGWHREGAPALPYLAEVQARFHEGKRMQRLQTIRGRNLSVREHCLNSHPPVCAVCELDPSAVFGAEFGNILEVHHLNPIAESEPGRTTDPREDCRPLCPTCHRLAHHGMRAGTCRSIPQLKVLRENFLPQ